jgi:hypothetical protein
LARERSLLHAFHAAVIPIGQCGAEHMCALWARHSLTVRAASYFSRAT